MFPTHIAPAGEAALVLGVAGLGWFSFWKRDRSQDPRRLIRMLVQRRVLKGRAAFAQLFPGAWVHFVPEGADLEKALGPGEAMAAREARGEPMVRFTLQDLYETDHPGVDHFAPQVGLPEGILPPDRVLFTVIPHLLRAQVEGTLDAQGLERIEAPFESSEADPFGRLVVRQGPYTHEMGIGDLVSDAVTAVIPLSRVAQDRAHRARAELELYAAFHQEVVSRFPLAAVSVEGPWLRLRLPGHPPQSLDYRRLATRIPGGRAGWGAWLERFEADPEALETSRGPWVARRLKPLQFVAQPEHAQVIADDRGGYVLAYAADTEWESEWLTPDHPLARGKSLPTLERMADAALGQAAFGGHLIVTGLGREGDTARSMTIVGTGAASIAQHPDLLAGAARAAGVFDPGDRVRVRVDTEGVLVVAEARASESFLAACRRAAARLAEAMDLGPGDALFLDYTGPLGERPVGHFAFARVDQRFFGASLQEQQARAEGDMAGAAEARAMMRLALGDPEGARVHLEEAVRLKPDDPGLQLALGTLLNDLGEHLRAETALRRGVALEPDNAAMNNNLGVAYLGLGRPDEAALFFEKAVGLHPEDPLTRVNLGRVRLELEDVPGAEDAFREALVQDRACVPALTGLVMVAVRRGDAEGARERLNRALAVDPVDDGLLRLHRALYPDEPVH